MAAVKNAVAQTVKAFGRLDILVNNAGVTALAPIDESKLEDFDRLFGLRSLAPPAATAWAAYLGWLKFERPLALIGSPPSVVIFTLLTIAELVADKLPQTPSRTAPPGLIARIVALAGSLWGFRAVLDLM